MDLQNNKLYRFSRWLIRLRYWGVVCIMLVTFFTSHFLNVSVQEFSLYVIAIVFLFLNISHNLLIMRIKRQKGNEPNRPLRILTNLQISADFIILTLLLHYSGGVENPFIVYFIFHMIMASIVLSPMESYLQAGFAWGLVIVLAVLEYTGIIQHYPLTGLIPPVLYSSRNYLLGTGLVFISTSFLVVYITNSIVMEARRHEAAYLKANKELEKKDEIKNEYVQRITHDIKGHLAAIKSCLDVMYSKQGSIGQDCKEFLVMASQRTSILIRFVKDLLYLSKMQLSNEIKASQFSLRDSINKVVSQLEHPASEKSIRINVDIDDSINQISGLQMSIEELISNLLGNAIQYSDPGSDIFLRAKALKGKIKMQIQDHGPGIPKAEREKIFEEFYRGSKTRASTEGTGLGLAISKKIIQAHEGKIWVESREGKGSTFCFTLPKDPTSGS